MSNQTLERDDLDQPYQHTRPLTGAAAAIFGMAYTLADIEARRAEAQANAQMTLDEMDAFDKQQQEIADRLVNGAPEDGLDIDYDVASEGDEC